MKKFFLVVKKHIKAQPFSSLLIVVIWVICLVPIPDTPLNNVKFFDKWTHLTMYGVLLLVIMTEYGHRKKNIQWKRLLCFGFIAAIVMSGLIELAQAYLTNGVRSGDWIDFAANAAGALLGFTIGILPARFLSTRNRDGQS